MNSHSRIRYMYLKSESGDPHTCVAIRVNFDNNSIEYATARRESVDGLVRLKQRINKIQELGGVVPGSLYCELKAFRKNFSKKYARFVACRRLDSASHSIEGMRMTKITAHEIGRAVMEAIAQDETYVSMEVQPYSSGTALPVLVRGETKQARISAMNWLQTNVENRKTIPKMIAENMLMVETLPSWDQDDQLQAAS